MAGMILGYAEKSGLSPFNADTLWKVFDKSFDKAEIQRIMEYLEFEGKLARLGDNRFLSQEAVEEIKKRVKRLIEEKGAMVLADCKEVLGYGRWGGAHVFDYLDKIGFTKKIGNERFLRKGRE
jgi:selenocysteine-specific elongation factor